MEKCEVCGKYIKGDVCSNCKKELVENKIKENTSFGLMKRVVRNGTLIYFVENVIFYEYEDVRYCCIVNILKSKKKVDLTDEILNNIVDDGDLIAVKNKNECIEVFTLLHNNIKYIVNFLIL